MCVLWIIRRPFHNRARAAAGGLDGDDCDGVVGGVRERELGRDGLGGRAGGVLGGSGRELEAGGETCADRIDSKEQNRKG
jgi:hypothetical protein